MLWYSLDTPYALRPKTGRDSFEETGSQIERYTASTEEKRWIVCRQCAQRLSRPGERIAVGGTHRHTFANPNGIVFEIGCYNMVTGCAFIGPPSYEFPWFPGHSWQIAICSSCQTHLGWIFRGQAGAQFVGLILDRIREIGAPEQ
jgi:hypothetical protein